MNILLGIGGSPDSRLALEETVNRVALTGDRLTVAILTDAPSETPVSELEDLVSRTMDDHEIDFELVVLEGDPGPTLTAFAEDRHIDRIVIGGGKRSPMGKIALGDITEFVVLNADTTVTLVR